MKVGNVMGMIIFKCFSTPDHKYIYDRQTNSIFHVSEAEFLELQKVEDGKIDIADSACIKKYQDYGFFQENTVTEIKHSQLDNLEHLVNRNMQQLTLQVTQQCNLRCAYCAYSGNYYNRDHASEKMSFETAKKAIDFFLARTAESEMLAFGFYGGEPFLEFDLMKKCVKYFLANANDKKHQFSLTTNGTLLTDEIVDWCVTNKVSLMISLDGSKEDHDANRKFVSGKGSFDTIIRNVKKIRDRYPNYYKINISFNTVINPRSHLTCVQEFFSTEEIFSDANLIFNSVKENGLKDTNLVQYEDRFWIPRRYEYFKLLLSAINKIDSNTLSPLVRNSRAQIDEIQRLLQSHISLGKYAHHGGPCVPGSRRLFVDVNGNLYPCEKVSESCPQMCIGTLNTGLDIQKMRFILNNGSLTENECLKCWNLINCAICLAEVDYKDQMEITREDKLKSCPKSKARTIGIFREICSLNEFGYRIPIKEDTNE